jgi:hypothetical protein
MTIWVTDVDHEFLPLTLSLGLVDIIAPDVDTMTTDENSICVRVLVHSLLEILSQILLMRGVLDDGNAESVMVAQVACLVHATAKALDLLDVVDLKDTVLSRALRLKQESNKDGPL